MSRSARMNVAVEAVRAAGREIRRFDVHRGMLKVDEKGPGDLVTNADLAAEAAALEVIAESYPKDGVLSEERGASGNQDSCWVLDPIDGTTNFVHGVPGYSVSLAWCRDGQPRVGAVLDVCRDDLYVAESGRGAYCDDRRIRVSRTRRLADALVGSCGRPGTRDWRWAFLAEASRKSSGFRRIGSAALDFALTARGAIDACLGGNLHYWDCAAGMLLVREAGGKFTNNLEGDADLPFGEKTELCLFGSERIVGALARMAARHRGGKG